MARLEDLGKLVTTQLSERVERLSETVGDRAPDFAEVAQLADAVGDLADTIAEIYSDLDETLLRGLRGDSDGSEPQQQQEASDDGDGTKEEILERARELNVQGRSSMTKEELLQAVEAEEGVTKEELLERAREAEIEGRSSMSKDELREALRDAGA